MSSRRHVVRACKSRGWTIQPDALDCLVDATHDNDSGSNDLATLLDALPMKGRRTVTVEVWDQSVAVASNEHGKGRTSGRRTGDDDLEIVSAFHCPKLVYQPMRQQFQTTLPSVTNNKHNNDGKAWPLLGTANDKIDMLKQRFALVQQRVRRHELFRRHQLNSTRGAHTMVAIESLLGQASNNIDHSSMVIVLGMLLQIEEGVYYLEDDTGQVRLHLADAVIPDMSYVTEHSVVFVEATILDGGTLHVHHLSQPVQESRPQALAAIAGHGGGVGSSIVSHQSSSSSRLSDDREFVILQDLHLDQPLVVQKLEGLLARYETNDNAADDNFPLFVLMGNFRSYGGDDHSVAVEDMATILSAFPRLAAHAHFCLVPGPRDGRAGPVLPRPGLVTVETSAHRVGAVAHLTVATNPCRIRWGTREMVVFRHDLLPLLQQHQIRLPSATIDEDSDCAMTGQLEPYCRMLKTVLDQGHLMPVSMQPLYWNYSHALSLYPMPDCLVISTDVAVHDKYESCTFVSPGSFWNGGSYAVYQAGREGDGNDAEVFVCEDPDSS